jgi:hypothetical protein
MKVVAASRDPDIEIEKKFLNAELVKVGGTVGAQVRSQPFLPYARP